MSFFRNMFSNYTFNTLESLKIMDEISIITRIKEINPNIWTDNSSYNDSDAMTKLGKERFTALMFGIRHSDKPVDKRIELWERKQEAKGIEKSLKSAPSTRNLPTPGGRERDQELADRLHRLRTEGGKKSRGKSMKSKSIRRKSMKSKSIRHKSIRRKSMKKKSIRRKSMKMH